MEAVICGVSSYSPNVLGRPKGKAEKQVMTSFHQIDGTEIRPHGAPELFQVDISRFKHNLNRNLDFVYEYKDTSLGLYAF